KPCEYPAIKNGKLSGSLEYGRYYYFPARLGQYVDYHCSNGYSTPSGDYWVRITCSERGWSPEPKCLKICQIRQVENGYFSRIRKNFYKEGERVRYVCNDDYRTEHKDGEVTCTKDDWSPPPRCIRKKLRWYLHTMVISGVPPIAIRTEEKCQKIHFAHGYFTSQKEIFNLQETVTYNCHTGFVTPEGHETGRIQCQENGWTASPKCITIECEMLTLPNGDFSPKKGKYRNGDVVKFTCANNYLRVGPASTQCYYFGWFPSPPVCKVGASGCGPPPAITNGTIAGDSVEQYRHGDRMQYACNDELKLVGSKEIECVDGQWSPPPSCI
ncbi:PREDICTED: coagulation factor XIII B chain-like, partial [Leptosomus discolor]|uniref:coagulation factor XIII B chain-like n=1 Tax=Leptosomus discolor TaxID=188344 RepID=UPI000522DD59